jgi:putative ABC transport system substrate-binding protein
MRRREFIKLASGAAVAWPRAAAAQTPLPVIGYLAQGTPEGTAAFLDAVRKGLGEGGLIEGRDFFSEFRYARNDVDRLPSLAVDLIQRRVAIIVALDTIAVARVAKAATTEIPILFTVGADPVTAGLVGSLNRPGGNVTGISSMNTAIVPKWIGLLHEVLSDAKRCAILVNVANAEAAKSLIMGAQDAAFASGLQTEVRFAGNEGEIDVAFAGLGARAQMLIIQPEVLFVQNLGKLAALTIRERLPAVYSTREFAEAGGLMTYGSSFIEAHRQAGVYAARILKGERPGELPVQLATKFDFVINLKTAKTLGLTIPQTLLATADEVIEQRVRFAAVAQVRLWPVTASTANGQRGSFVGQPRVP